MNTQLSASLFAECLALWRRLEAARSTEFRRHIRAKTALDDLKGERDLLATESELLNRALRQGCTVTVAAVDSLRARQESLAEKTELAEQFDPNWKPAAIPEADEILVSIAEHYQGLMERSGKGSRRGRVICESLKRLVGWIEARRTLNRTPHHDAVLRSVLENALLGVEDVFPERFYTLQVPAL